MFNKRLSVYHCVDEQYKMCEYMCTYTCNAPRSLAFE